MRRFHFPLEQALRYKERRERVAANVQLQALAKKQQWDAEVHRIKEGLDETARLLQGQMGKPVNLCTWFATLTRSQQLARELQAAQLEAARVNEKLEAARQEHAQAAKEAEAIRVLRHRQRQRHLADMARAEQKVLEEMALLRWQDGEVQEKGGGGS